MEVSRKAGELGMALVTSALGAIVCYGSLENGIAWGSSGPEPGYFPFYVGCLIILGSVGVAVQALIKGADGEPVIDAARFKSVASFFIPIVVFVAISAFLGLYIGMAIYTFYAMYWPGRMKLATSVITTIIVLAVNWIIFEMLFLVPLLKGPVLNHFGIY